MKLTRRATLGAAGAAGAAAVTGGLVAPQAAQANRGGGASERKINRLIGQMTLDEKIGMLHGGTDPEDLGQAGYIPGVERLGIEPLRLADGPAGVRVTANATALPAPVMLASTFDTGLAKAYGKVIGHEGQALGQDVLLSPMCNLIRTPYAGRNFETFSEDPLLTADIVGAEVEGIQGEGLIATVKHFAMNNQEKDRSSINVVVDEQTMQETELRGFKGAVESGSGAVMGAYNKVNGDWSCENPYLLNDVLREMWDFPGWVMSDWGATHSTLASLEAGLEMEMPGGTYHGDALKTAVEDGTVSEDLVDRAVGRILTVMDRFGLLDGGNERPDRDAEAGAATALEVARKGAVLLRNENVLPLSAAGSIALIGPTAEVAFVSGGGSAHVVPDHADSPLDVITERASEVVYSIGEDLYGHEFWELRTVAAGESYEYSEEVVLDADDNWTLFLHYTGTRLAVRLDGEEVIGGRGFFSGGLDTSPEGRSVVRAKDLDLTAGTHTITVTVDNGDSQTQYLLNRSTTETRAADVADAVAAAAAADTAIVFVYEDATEGSDRTTIALPGSQDALIAAVAEANPRTVVVLNTSSATSMPWLDATGAVLQAYYPGQEGAEATADILFGDVNPSGRLTQSFPVDDDSHPTAGNPLQYPGVDGEQEYTEGIHVGYRWYEDEGVEPLFPFGFGLSYTTFEYSGLTVTPRGSGARVTFTVANTGRRTGTEVAQVYAGPSPDLDLPQASKVLVGYTRVELRARKSAKVTIDIPEEALSSWDADRGDWALGTGKRKFSVGRNATDLPLSGTAKIRRR